MTAISTIPNLGPATEAAFAAVGIHTAEELHAIGADAAYARLLANGTRPHFIGYYVIVLGLQNRPFNALGAEEKAALRLRFDALKAGHGVAAQTDGPSPALAGFMRDFGLIAPR